MSYRILTLMALMSLTPLASNGQPAIPPPPKTPVPVVKMDVITRYKPSGWMGDGKEQNKYVQLNLSCTNNPRRQSIDCVMIKYTPGTERWAGIYWLNKPNNWGDLPGDNFSDAGYSKITFWVRGETGGEKVEFKAGGVNDLKKAHKDLFEASTDMIRLSRVWERHEINLQGKNLSGVIGVFCWTVDIAANPSGAIFYLDDICYE